MRVRANGLVGMGIVLLVSVAAFAAEVDLRLVEAVEKGDQSAVRALLGQNVDVNLSQADGTTALAWAVHRNDMETAELLIGAGANVNVANEYGVTPLSLACTNRNAAMIGKLLQAGANPNAAQWTGETPVMTCARTGSVDGVKALLDRGASPNAKESQKGQTALMWAIAEKHDEVVRILIDRGADVQARSKSGFTALMFAGQQDALEAARMLVAAGADVNAATPENGTALVVASASGNEDVAIFLAENGSDPNAKDADGITALHYAAQKGMTVVSGVDSDPFLAYLFRPNMRGLAKSLLAHGADPNARIKNPPSRLMLMYRPRLRLAGATPFFMAAASEDAELMRILADAGADPRLPTEAGTTPLMVAAGLGRIPLAQRTEEEQRNALEAVKAAVELGNDVNAAGERGMTALQGAASGGSESIIQFLADSGANVNQMDRCGQTALSVAMGDPEGLVDRSDRHKISKTKADLLRQLGATPQPFTPLAPCQHIRHNATKDTEYGEFQGLAPL
jgi:ankyrin repeat protein